jgi:hypothetical protein
LYPGLYDSIEITGGDVFFHPGIYVTLGGKPNAMKITGGLVNAEGLLFYNTRNNYQSDFGLPDDNDKSLKPPFGDGAKVGGVTLNAGMKFSPIDSTNPAFDYSGQPGIGVFDGMLFFQRRRNTQPAEIQGDSSSGLLTGTIYAKWAHFKISGQGTYDAQFVVGSMNVPGQGDVELIYGGKLLGKAPAVFLVE